MKNSDGSWDAFDDYVIDFALERMDAGERVALVTLVLIEGASPRPLGAQMAVSETGQSVGYLSGGCIERAVVAEAVSAIGTDENRRVRYGRGSRYIDIQLPCGSAIELLFEVTRTASELAAIDARQRLRLGASITVASDGEEADPDRLAVRHYMPRRRLIVAGVGPAAVQLTRLGQATGFETSLLSPDGPTAEAVHSAGIATQRILSPSRLPALQADSRTAIVLMFHDHLWDMHLIPAALETSAFYIGAMGSFATHKKRLQQLQKLGFDPSQFSRIHGPAGLFASAKSASDISVSILAEIMQVDQQQAPDSASRSAAASGVTAPAADTHH